MDFAQQRHYIIKTKSTLRRDEKWLTIEQHPHKSHGKRWNST